MPVWALKSFKGPRLTKKISTRIGKANGKKEFRTKSLTKSPTLWTSMSHESRVGWTKKPKKDSDPRVVVSCAINRGIWRGTAPLVEEEIALRKSPWWGWSPRRHRWSKRKMVTSKTPKWLSIEEIGWWPNCVEWACRKETKSLMPWLIRRIFDKSWVSSCAQDWELS